MNKEKWISLILAIIIFMIIQLLIGSFNLVNFIIAIIITGAVLQLITVFKNNK